MSKPALARLRTAVALIALMASIAGCQVLSGVSGQSDVRCGRFEGPDCNDLLELGLDAVAGGRVDAPSVIAVGGACPDNARCMASALGGETAAVVVLWADGTVRWATIPLTADWPARRPGPAEAQEGPTPDHLLALLGSDG